MTAYGRGSLTTKTGHFVIELRSVNRKFLEITLSLPKELSQFDSELKKWLSPHVMRGQVTVQVSAFFEDGTPLIVKPNLPLIKQLKAAWEEAGRELHIDEPFSLSFLSQVDGVFIYEENLKEEETYRAILEQAFAIALENFLSMRNQEGAVLQADIAKRLESLHEMMRQIEQRSPQTINKYREKLTARLEELLPGRVENEERLLREIGLFAERVDIAEEITRFFCHLVHFKEAMDSSVLGVGKTLEFILQELDREINTIGSKAADIEIARLVIEIKSELKRIREQIQNIE